MAILSISVDDFGAEPEAGYRITAKLTKADEVTGTIVAPSLHQVYTDEAGVAELDLWPNELGTTGSLYRIKIFSRGGQKIIEKMIVLPAVGASLADLEDVSDSSAPRKATSFGGSVNISSSETLGLNRAGKWLRCDSEGMTLTIPASSTVRHAKSTEIYLFRIGIGVVQIEAEDGVTTFPPTPLTVSAQFKAVCLKYADNDEWDIIGAVE